MVVTFLIRTLAARIRKRRVPDGSHRLVSSGLRAALVAAAVVALVAIVGIVGIVGIVALIG